MSALEPRTADAHPAEDFWCSICDRGAEGCMHPLANPAVLVHKQQPCCTCMPTDPKAWTQYGSAVEPGSQLEPNPDCPLHFPSEDAFGITHGATIEQAVGLAASLIQTAVEAEQTVRRLEGVIEQKAIEGNK